jgi:thioredoxin reductase
VVVVGGGSAGLSAALLLGRSRRRVLVSDTAKARNAVAQESHSFFTRDGTTPAELLRIGREQLRPYETVEFYSVGVKAAKAKSKGFEATLEDGTLVNTRKLLLATGVVDEMPEIEVSRSYGAKAFFIVPIVMGGKCGTSRLRFLATVLSGLNLPNCSKDGAMT